MYPTHTDDQQKYIDAWTAHLNQFKHMDYNLMGQGEHFYEKMVKLRNQMEYLIRIASEDLT